MRLYIFDADGTLRWTVVPHQKYPLASSEWRLMPGVTDRLRALPLSPEGPWLAIASNQNGVGEGILDEATARLLIEEMLLAALGHVPAETRIALSVCREEAGCTCRKPAPGLLIGLMDAYGVTPEETLFVGDLPIDEEAARRAGVRYEPARSFFGCLE